jgi:DNA-binding transcriptional ArsR family regulator
MEITDPRAIRALAHPLRLDLLDLLVAIGPATAAQCGRILGVPQANCSFHLRQLAKYGFVEDAGAGADRRERQWRVPDPRLRFPGGEGRAAGSSLQQVVLRRAMQTIADFSERLDAEPPHWQDAATVMSGVALLTAAEAAELKEQWSALLAPYLARAVGSGLHPGPGQRHVRYFLAGTPLPVRPSTPEEAGDEPGD